MLLMLCNLVSSWLLCVWLILWLVLCLFYLCGLLVSRFVVWFMWLVLLLSWVCSVCLMCLCVSVSLFFSSVCCLGVRVVFMEFFVVMFLFVVCVGFEVC